MNIAEFSIKKSIITWTVTVVVLALGYLAYQNLPRLEDPELISRNAVVYTRFPGANAERVEALVTEKIEEELFDVEEIKTLESTSRAGISIIEVELHDEVIDADGRAGRRRMGEPGVHQLVGKNHRILQTNVPVTDVDQCGRRRGRCHGW